MRRVVVTGMGIVSSLGHTVAAAYERLKTPRNCVRRSDELQAYRGLQTCLWAPCGYVRPPDYTRKVIRTMSPVSEMALFATDQALAQAGLLGDPVVKGGRLEFAPGARVADGAITVSPGASVFLPDGYVLDLGGQTLSVQSIGGSGIVRNGTLVVTGEIQPGGVQSVGTLTFERAPVVAGATLVIDGDGRGGYDRLVVEEAFDVTGLRIRPSRRTGFAPGAHRIVSCRSLAGQDALVPDLPRHFAIRVPVSGDGIDLVREQLGTLLLIR